VRHVGEEDVGRGGELERQQGEAADRVAVAAVALLELEADVPRFAVGQEDVDREPPPRVLR
jgi:hypothetical protein